MKLIEYNSDGHPSLSYEDIVIWTRRWVVGGEAHLVRRYEYDGGDYEGILRRMNKYQHRGPFAGCFSCGKLLQEEIDRVVLGTIDPETTI